MRENDLEEFSGLLDKIAGMYEKNLPHEVKDIYLAVLGKYDVQTLKKAFAAHAADPKSGQFMPKPADLVRNIQAATGGAPEIKALKLWSEITWQMERSGARRTQRFEDPLVNTILQEMGGWKFLCHAELKLWPAFQKDFEKRYVAHSVNPPELVADCLPGWESGDEINLVKISHYVASRWPNALENKKDGRFPGFPQFERK